MTTDPGRMPRSSLHSPIATPEEVGAEPPAFPVKTAVRPIETFFGDWRARLTRNLSRRSTSRWEPLTWVHSPEASRSLPRAVMPSRRFDEFRDTALWSAVEGMITELAATREISVNTAPEYVIGYLCQELAAKKLVTAAPPVN